ncbi:MAG: hypothetical protein ACN6OP_06985 [Pseudomonadales bacterium]
MRFYLQIETQLGWRYLRRGYWDRSSVDEQRPQVKRGENLTDDVEHAEWWSQRGVQTRHGRCSFDVVATELLKSGYKTRFVSIDWKGHQGGRELSLE